MRKLTERQRQVCELLAEGLTNKEIANRLGIAEATVKNHLNRIFERLNVRNRTAMAVWYQRHKIAEGKQRSA